MDILRFICISLLLTVTTGCSAEDSDRSAEDSNRSAQETPLSSSSAEQTYTASVVPVTILPEDQEKAKMAPEGMVFIKGGCFIMGNDFAQTDETPEHEVCVDDFYMDRYEVTQARWVKVMGGNPAKFIGDENPVEQVNYYDVQNFIKKSEGACRLPTEAEWEYAAGGLTVESRYYWGNMMDDAYAWFEDNSAGTTHPVGKKLPNQFGLYDMMGNVWEWTEDWYAPVYESGKQNNPKGAMDGDNKVIRGGAFDSSAGALRITNRTWVHPRNRVFPKVTTYGQVVNEIYNYIGFRCAQSIPTASKP